MTNTLHAAQVLDLVAQLASHINDPRLNDFIGLLPHPPVSLLERDPTFLPVLNHLATAVQSSPPASLDLLTYLQNNQKSLFWGQTYNADDFGPKFLETYGWTEFAGSRGPALCDEIACGVLFLGPMTDYPLHAHLAEEIYIPLTGTAQWKMNDGDWAERSPLEVIHHPSWTPHATRTLTEPLIALYFWRGGDIKQKSKIDFSASSL